MSTIPRPGHADYTYQVKYGVRATSGGGRSSARETIGRVAASMVAEKWLRQEYGTEVVAFVGSIGDIVLPLDGRSNGGVPWTRQQVDELGRLLILHNPAVWHPVTEAEVQLELDKVAEASFLAMSDSEAATLPAYEGGDGKIYNSQGAELPALSAEQLKACRSVALIHVRCPHAPTACKMASLIRQVKSEQDSIGGTIIGHVTGK